MKALNKFIPILLIPMLIACGQSSNSSDVIESSNTSDISSLNDSSLDSSSNSSNKPSSSSFTSLSTESVSEGCGISGSLIEITTGCYLETGGAYSCSLTPTGYTNKKIRIVISDETICTTKFLNNSLNNFEIDTLKQGDAIIKVYADEDDYLLFRDVIHVRDPYSKNDIEDVVFETYDIWNATGIYGTYTMTFFTVNPLSGLLYGKDDYENTTLNFSLTYVETKKIYDFTFHSFSVTVDTENSNTRRTYTEVDIAVTGDNILFYYEEGLLEMFRPAELYTPIKRS